MATTTKKETTTREQLPESVEKKMVETINAEFASENETFRAAAIVWGRKQLKFERGVRSTKPPIPAGLQHPSNRAKTQARIESIAKAIGADINYGSKTAATEPEKPTVEVTPDPKPATTRRSRAAKPKTEETAAA